MYENIIYGFFEKHGPYHHATPHCTPISKFNLDRTMWRARFGRGFGPVIRQTTK